MEFEDLVMSKAKFIFFEDVRWYSFGYSGQHPSPEYRMPYQKGERFFRGAESGCVPWGESSYLVRDEESWCRFSWLYEDGKRRHWVHQRPFVRDVSYPCRFSLINVIKGILLNLSRMLSNVSKFRVQFHNWYHRHGDHSEDESKYELYFSSIAENWNPNFAHYNI